MSFWRWSERNCWDQCPLVHLLWIQLWNHLDVPFPHHKFLTARRSIATDHTLGWPVTVPTSWCIFDLFHFVGGSYTSSGQCDLFVLDRLRLHLLKLCLYVGKSSFTIYNNMKKICFHVITNSWLCCLVHSGQLVEQIDHIVCIDSVVVLYPLSITCCSLLVLFVCCSFCMGV